MCMYLRCGVLISLRFLLKLICIARVFSCWTRSNKIASIDAYLAICIVVYRNFTKTLDRRSDTRIQQGAFGPTDSGESSISIVNAIHRLQVDKGWPQPPSGSAAGWGFPGKGGHGQGWPQQPSGSAAGWGFPGKGGHGQGWPQQPSGSAAGWGFPGHGGQGQGQGQGWPQQPGSGAGWTPPSGSQASGPLGVDCSGSNAGGWTPPGGGEGWGMPSGVGSGGPPPGTGYSLRGSSSEEMPVSSTEGSDNSEPATPSSSGDSSETEASGMDSGTEDQGSQPASSGAETQVSDVPQTDTSSS